MIFECFRGNHKEQTGNTCEFSFFFTYLVAEQVLQNVFTYLVLRQICNTSLYRVCVTTTEIRLLFDIRSVMISHVQTL